MDRDTLARICTRIEDGELTEEAARAEGTTGTTLRRYLSDWRGSAEDRALYARARSIAADALAEEAVRISLDRSRDANDRRVAADALKWLAGKRRPKDYGDKVEHEVSGSIGHLHLDALRAPRITANAMLAKGLEALTSGDTSPEETPNPTSEESPPQI